MTTSREDIREHLTAVIEAARELPEEDRAYLADTFLDQLETQYQLVPRSGTPRMGSPVSSRSWLGGLPFGWSPLVVIALAALFSIFVVPALLFALLAPFHFPVLLVVLLFFLVLRFTRPHSRRGSWRYGPRRGGVTRYDF